MFYFTKPQSTNDTILPLNTNFYTKETMITDNDAVTDPEIKIIDLNAECLIEIFKYLDYIDLLHLQKTHPAFDSAIEYIVKTRHLPLKIDIRRKTEDVTSIVEFLQLFGKQMKYLSIQIIDSLKQLVRYNFTHFDAIVDILPDLEQAIKNHCSGGNVKFCSLNLFELRREFLASNAKFFNELETLDVVNSINECDFPWFFDFVLASGVRKIKIIIYSGFSVSYDIFQRIAASQLESCIINFNNCSDFSTDNVPVNSTLKHLNLGQFEYDSNILARCFPMIEHLYFEWISLNTEYLLDPILNLTQMKHLQFRCSCVEFNQIATFFQTVAQRNHLETLSLKIWSVSDDDTHSNVEQSLAEILCKMTNLVELTVDTDLILDQYLPVLGRSLRSLRRMNLKPAFLSKSIAEILPVIYGFLEINESLHCLTLAIEDILGFQENYSEQVRIQRMQGNNRPYQVTYIFCTHDEPNVEQTVVKGVKTFKYNIIFVFIFECFAFINFVLPVNLIFSL